MCRHLSAYFYCLRGTYFLWGRANEAVMTYTVNMNGTNYISWCRGISFIDYKFYYGSSSFHTKRVNYNNIIPPVEYRCECTLSNPPGGGAAGKGIPNNKTIEVLFANNTRLTYQNEAYGHYE